MADDPIAPQGETVTGMKVTGIIADQVQQHDYIMIPRPVSRAVRNRDEGAEELARGLTVVPRYLDNRPALRPGQGGCGPGFVLRNQRDQGLVLT